MKRYELIVVGAGPAGLSAAIEAAAEGMEVVVFDENKRPGGQLFKQIHKFFGSKEHKARQRGFKIGEELLAKAEKFGVEVKLESTVMGIFENKELSVMITDEIKHFRADKIIVATGAYEKMVPFKGWTLPGVIGAGAAQTMMNIHGIKAGDKVLMVGSGNVGLVVGYQLLQAGCKLEAVIDAADRIGGYGVHAAKLARTGVPFYTSHTITEAKGEEKVTSAVIAEVDENWEKIKGSEKELDVDTICMAVGLSPMSQLVEMADCKMEKGNNGLVPVCDKYGETSVSGIYAAGDVAGIEEASAAMVEGKISAVGVLYNLGYLTEKELKQRFNNYEASLQQLRQGMFGVGEGDWDYPQKTEEGYELSDNLLAKGYLTEKEVAAYPGVLAEENKSGVVPVIECTQNIPCDPCKDICHSDCIKIEGEIIKLPEVDQEIECSGCEICVAACPGQAVFLVNENYSSDYATVALPYEFSPLPEVGEKGKALNRAGEVVGQAEVVKLNQAEITDKTVVLTMKVAKDLAMEARFFKAEESSD